jgi:hypothetical protein
VYVSAPNPVCVEGFPWNTGQHHAGQSKVGMIEDVEELAVQSHGQLLAKRNSFCQIHVGPEESGDRGTGFCRSATKLAVCRTIPTDTGARAGINRGDMNASGFSHCTVPGWVVARLQWRQ